VRQPCDGFGVFRRELDQNLSEGAAALIGLVVVLVVLVAGAWIAVLAVDPR
jgi:hypothetical protein